MSLMPRSIICWDAFSCFFVAPGAGSSCRMSTAIAVQDSDFSPGNLSTSSCGRAGPVPRMT